MLIKLIIFGSVLSILPVVFIGVFSYIQSSNQVQKQINHAELQFLQQVNSNIEQILLTVEHTLTNLLESNVMEEAMYSPLQALDFQLYNNLRSEIIHLQSFDTKVYEVVLLNKRHNWLIRNAGITRLDQHPDYEQFLTYFDLEHVSSWQLIRNRDFEELSQQNWSCAYTISLIRKLPHIRTEKYGLAFANMNACSLADVIYNGLESEEVMIVDNERQIIVHRDPSLIGTELSEHPIFNGNGDMEFAERSGQLQLSNENRPYTVTYFQSEYNNWTYLSVVSIDELTKESRQIGWFTFIVCLAIIAVSIVFVWLISKRLYLPVNKLVTAIQGNAAVRDPKPVNEMQLIENYIDHLFSSNSKLENEMRQHIQQVRSLFLSRLYSGTLHPSEIREKLKQFDLIEQVDRWHSMAVMTMQVDTLDNTQYEMKDMDLLLFAVSNIVEETIAREERFPTVWFDRTLVILTGFAESDADRVKPRIYELTESFKSLIEQYLHLSVSIGISSLFRDIGQASRAYEEGVEALKHRMILGKGVIVPYNDVHSGKPVVIHEYPARLEHELVDAIKIADQKEALLLLEEWMKEAVNRMPSPTDYQVSVMRLLNRLLILKQEAGISFDQLGVHKTSIYDEVLSLHMSEKIAEWFKDRLIMPLIRVFSERRDSQYHSLSEQMIDLIQRHYDQELTLEDCAAQLHYNASYLSSVFKNETGHTFSEYLGNYRLQVAKKWLTETGMTVKEIAERLHYSNSHNFIRSFRKAEGMTPGQYRDKYSQ